MYCTHCGAPLTTDAKFCAACGLATATPQTASTSIPVSAAPLQVPETAGKNPPPAQRLSAVLSEVRPTQAQLSGDARSVAVAIGLQLLSCLGITLIVALLLPSGHHGSVVDWLRGMVVLGGFAQRGAVTADASASALSVSGQMFASLTAPPLFLTALLVGLLAVLLRRGEREKPSQTWQIAAGRTLVSALGYGLTWALLGALVNGQPGFGLTTDSRIAAATVGLSFWSVLGHGLLIATLAGAAVHLLPQLRSHPSWWERVADARHALAATATLTVITWAAMVVVVSGWVIYSAVTSDQSFSQGVSSPVENIAGGQVKAGVAALLVMAALSLNIVMVGGAVMLGNAVGYTGDDHGLTEVPSALQSQNVGIFLGSFSSWWYLAPLLLWLAALLVGARAGGRFAPTSRGGRVLAHYVGAAVVTSVAVAALTRFLLNISVAGSLADGRRSASYSASAGIGGKSSLLIGAVVALLLWSGHRLLLPELAAGYPRQLAGVLGKGMHPAWALALADATVRNGQTPQPWLLRMADDAAHLQVRPIQLGRRRLVVLAGGLGALVILAIGVTLGNSWLSTSVFGPESTVRTFADAQARGDSSGALGTLADPPKANTVGEAALTHEVADHPMTDLKITVHDQQDDTAAARLTYKQDGKTIERTLSLRQEADSGRFFGLYPKWLIVEGAMTEVAVDTAGSQADLGEIRVLGQRVDPAAGPYPVFPGLVDVTAAGTSTVQPVDQKVDLTGQDATPVALTASLRPEAETAAVAAVQKSMADCMAQRRLAPVGCPFSTTSYGEPPLNVRWSLTGTPQIEVTLNESGQMAIAGIAELRVAYVQSGLFGANSVDDPISADLSGSASYDGKTASVTYDSANSAGTD